MLVFRAAVRLIVSLTNRVALADQTSVSSLTFKEVHMGREKIIDRSLGRGEPRSQRCPLCGVCVSEEPSRHLNPRVAEFKPLLQDNRCRLQRILSLQAN